ncbi:MAG: tail fiber domain-containing protein [Chitinophagaceae bacterium]|nr:tail fiber domain-containing protein [Chitinophagaceae bacterium]
MIHLKASNRFVGVNTDNPFHALSLLIATNAVFTLPYDGLSVMTPNNPANTASGLVVGSDPSDYVNKGVWNYDDGKIAFGTNNLERVTITNTGDVGIGIATPSEKLHVIGNILASGTITPSDLRYKKNIQELNSPLSKLKQVRGVTYQYKTDEFPKMGFTDAVQIGFIAQEVEKVFPELVVTGKNGYKGIDYSKITPVLLEAIKDQQKQIDELNRKLEKLIPVNKN